MTWTCCGPCVVLRYTRSSWTNKSCPSTSSTPMCRARKLCSKYAELYGPGDSTTAHGSSPAPAGATENRASGGRHGARDQIEGKDLLHAAAVGVDGEGDALVDEHEVGVGALGLELARPQPAEPVHQEAAVVVRPVGALEQLVPGRGVPAIPAE